MVSDNCLCCLTLYVEFATLGGAVAVVDRMYSTEIHRIRYRLASKKLPSCGCGLV